MNKTERIPVVSETMYETNAKVTVKYIPTIEQIIYEFSVAIFIKKENEEI